MPPFELNRTTTPLPLPEIERPGHFTPAVEITPEDHHEESVGASAADLDAFAITPEDDDEAMAAPDVTETVAAIEPDTAVLPAAANVQDDQDDEKPPAARVPEANDTNIPAETAPAGDTRTTETAAPTTDKYAQQYARQRAILESRHNNATSRMEPAKQRDETNKAAWRTIRGTEPPENTFNGADVLERTIDETEALLEVCRPSSAEDVDYRHQVQDRLGPTIVADMPPELPLRFHGTNIIRAKNVIASHGLSSSVDRLGYQTSYDVSGQVSVATAETLDTSLGSYTGLNDENYCVPPGCLFVMLPDSPQEAENSGTTMIMRNIDFVEQPEQLVGILTAPENIPTVQGWAAEAGINPATVQEFFAFAGQLADIKKSIAAGETTLQDYLPYQLPKTTRTTRV
ncbi:MAG TPA: hypothetical protein VGO07_07270 [Candidatus Saccharimonadales bacterium]|jgi:hypothetical protein|nr:hypothetical protein [Candidatus Saccharimonadales bacterium]